MSSFAHTSDNERLKDAVAEEAAQLGSTPSVRANAHAEAEVFDLVCAHMRMLMGSGAPDYDDLVQSAAERALRDLGQFEGRSSLSTWVFRVCYSTMLDHHRWYKRWLRRLVAEPDLDALPIESEQETVEEALQWHQRNIRLRAAVRRLSPKYGVVVTLHDLQGQHVNAIAEQLGIGVHTVRSRLRDGRKELARRLRADPDFGAGRRS